MNKISKKIVALVTMAAFVLTLVPAAAFGAEYGSTVKVDADTQEITLTKDGTADIKVEVNLVAEDATKINARTDDALYVWLEKDGVAYNSYATYKEGATIVSGKDGSLDGVGQITVDADTATKKTATITVKNAGKYTVHAGYSTDDNVKNISDLKQITAVSDEATATVNNVELVANKLTVSGTTNETANKGGVLDLGFVPNGIKAKTVTVQVESVFKSDNSASSDSVGKVIAINNPYDNLSVVNAKGEAITEVTIETGKTASFDVIADSSTEPGNYVLTLTCDSLTYALTIKVESTDVVPKTIEVVKTDTSVIAYNATSSADKSLEEVAQFELKNANGDVLDLSTAATQQFENYSATDYVKVIKQPKGSKLTAANFKVADTTATGDSNVALVVSNQNVLAVGDYTVRVSLDNGASADVSFSVANVGETVDMVISDLKDTTDNVDVTNDSVVLGHTITGKVYYVDENGLKTDATNVKVGIDGINLTSVTADKSFTFTVSSDAEKALGSKVVITAFDKTVNKLVTKELTVVDGKSTNTLAFDNENGSVQKNNVVKVTVVDEDGNLVNVNNADLYAYVASSTTEDANVYVAEKTAKVNKGEGQLTIYSDKETTAEIVVAVDDGDRIYANTLKYTFGEEEIPADTSIVMTIGSSDFVVNNDVVNVPDAAPYIANDRTYVPFRALGEALGAEVEWDNDARTVTYTLGKTEVVMTIGETTYTVNGEEKTMDVAPEITNDRTYVPVRFVGEALGFKVTALSAADGTTASVVFQK